MFFLFKKIFIFLIIFIFPIQMNAQQNDNIAGEYYLRGVMETASGFKINTDSTFEFFFSYGALDRSGSGTWKKEGSKITFNSAPAPGQNFALTKSTSTNDDFITIKISDPNTIFLSGIYAIIKSGDKKQEAMSNKEGIIRFPKMKADSICLLFEFVPERTAVFAISNPSDNHFEFRFEPWVMEVFFKNFTLEIESGGLKGGHPLLKEGIYHFNRN